MQYRNLLLYLLPLILIVTAPVFPAVEIYDTSVSPNVPANIDYMLNCPADVTIAILPSTSGGTPTGPAVKTVTFAGQSKGFHRYIWLGDTDGGAMAPVGAYYVPRITANASQAQWAPISGLYRNDDWTHESAWIPLPPVPGTEAFHGIGINKNPNSPYYGRIYTTHKAQKDVLMYGPAGNYLGTFDDPSVPWGVSAPWDLSVADDGYVYVCDRTTMYIHCFGSQGNLVSTSPPNLTNFRAIFARTTPDGRTHVFYSGSAGGVREIIVEPDHVTWQAPFTVYNPGSSSDVFGMWVSPDLSVIFQACVSGANAGVTKWLRQPAGTYVKDTTWVSNVGPAVDVDVNGLGWPAEFMWVTKNVAYATDVRAIHKASAATGSAYYPPNADYGIVTSALMCCADGVGNIAVTFGQPAVTWAQRFWGLFAEPGVSTSQKTLTPCYVPPTSMCPVIVPGSVVWTPDNVIAGDNVDSASASFKIRSMYGWQDIGRVTIDLTPLGYAPRDAVIAPDLTDPAGMTAIATVSDIKAKVGTRCSTSHGQPPHRLVVTMHRDTVSGPCLDDFSLELNVSGSMVDANIRHRRVAGWNVDGAQIQAVGGGIPGTTDPRAAGPFTYLSAPSDAAGMAALEIGAGTFQVSAQKTGFKPDTPVYLTAPYSGGPLSLYLKPFTVAETRSMSNGAKVNVEGVCFAQPVGYDCMGVLEQYGLAPRMESSGRRNQWYMCDPNDPANGILCLTPTRSDGFEPQWDCPNGAGDLDIWTYMGKRPEQGETIMVTAMLDTPSGYERRLLLDRDELQLGMQNATINRIYLNRDDIGGYPLDPVVVPLSQVSHPGTTGMSNTWGKYVQVNNVTVIRINPIGDDNPLGEPVPYALVADMQGNTAEIVLQTPQTLGMDQWLSTGLAPDLGCTYDIRGAAGRRNRYGSGCIRVRSYNDFIQIPGGCIDGSFPDDPAGIKAVQTGQPVKARGIVTAKVGSSMWIETADGSSGIRVMVNPSYVAVGDEVGVTGTVAMFDGERVVQPTAVVMPLSTGNAVPAAFDLRTREVGGAGCLENPGVTDGRGALNVGLRVHVQGMITARDLSASPAWYYVWDGANRTDMPVHDGTGHIGVRIEGTPPTGVVAWRDWVDVTGVASTDASLVSGRVAATIIPTSASKVTAFDTITTPANQPLKARWNLMSVPVAPAGTSDGDEWSAKPWDPYTVLAPNGDPEQIDGRLFRWENCTGGLYVWDLWSEWSGVGTHGPFGGMLLGDGYWLHIDEDWPVSYSGRNSSLDQWVGICSSGWTILGHPKDHATALADVKVHDGSQVISMYDAVMDKMWIDCAGMWWDSQAQGLVDIGIPDCFASTDSLLPWHGYWLRSYRGNLALIVPEAPAAP